MTSGGGTGSYGPTQLNNGIYEIPPPCNFSWVTASSTPGTAWFRLEWATARTLWGIWIDTNLYDDAATCWYGSTLAGGSIQGWDGSNWVPDGVVTGELDDWGYQFSMPIYTTSIRIYGAHASATSPGQTTNPLVYELDAYECL